MNSDENIDYRLAKQNSFCRVCDKTNRRGKDMVIYIYSHRNRGQNILICEDCARKIEAIVEGENSSRYVY